MEKPQRRGDFADREIGAREQLPGGANPQFQQAAGEIQTALQPEQVGKTRFAQRNFFRHVAEPDRFHIVAPQVFQRFDNPGIPDAAGQNLRTAQIEQIDQLVKCNPDQRRERIPEFRLPDRQFPERLFGALVVSRRRLLRAERAVHHHADDPSVFADRHQKFRRARMTAQQKRFRPHPQLPGDASGVVLNAALLRDGFDRIAERADVTGVGEG